MSQDALILLNWDSLCFYSTLNSKIMILWCPLTWFFSHNACNENISVLHASIQEFLHCRWSTIGPTVWCSFEQRSLPRWLPLSWRQRQQAGQVAFPGHPTEWTVCSQHWCLGLGRHNVGDSYKVKFFQIILIHSLQFILLQGSATVPWCGSLWDGGLPCGWI